MPSFYQLDPQTYDDQFWWKKDDILFWEKQFKNNSQDSILELASGTGRIGHNLYNNNPNYEGLDISKEYVDFANDKLDNQNLKKPIHCLDMRKFNLANEYKYIFIGFNSFLHLLNDVDIFKMLRCIKKHMNKNSLFYIDIFNPHPSMFSDARKDILDFFDSKHQCNAKIYEQTDYSYETNLISVFWEYCNPKGEIYKQFQFEMKIYYPDTINRILVDSGLKILNFWGDYTKEKFSEKSEKQIYECQLK